jgi:hypothetical protein
MTNKDVTILNPEEVKRRRQTVVYEDAEAVKEEQETLAKNFANTVQIDYESEGRFDTPATLHFKDYSNRHINDIQLSAQDDLLDVICVILNDLKKDENDFKVEDMTAEDLLETLMSIKVKYEGQFHNHRWLCSCQNEVDERNRIVNETSIDLLSLNYKSISQVDEEMKEFFKEKIEPLTDEEFKEYLVKKYKDNPIDDIDSYTKEMEIEKVKVSEPIYFISDEDIYGVRFPRVKDIIQAKNYAQKMYAPKIKSVQNRKEANVPLAELKEKKEKEIQKLKEDQARLLFLYAKSMILLKKNGKDLSPKERFEEYRDTLSRSTTESINEFFQKVQFGLQHELELVCPICGETDKRWLQRVIDPRELLPYGDSSRITPVSSDGKSGQHSGFNIYFGV